MLTILVAIECQLYLLARAAQIASCLLDLLLGASVQHLLLILRLMGLFVILDHLTGVIIDDNFVS